MSTYEDSGVNIDLGDKCSAIAYQAAKNTFPGRKGMMGEPVIDEGGFSGVMDMGDYYLVQNDDGIGTKMIIAEKTENLGTMGYDLVAMVADDAICIGAETISLSNTLDVDNVNEDKIRALMAGLERACLEHKIIIPGGEIAELGEMVNGYIWNSTAVGIVEKDKLITGANIKAGDKIIGLKSDGLRSNGFSLVRHILKNALGDNWYFEKYNDTMTWAEAVLTPSKIYSSAVLEMHGRYKEKAKVELKGVVHVTGGGIKGNLKRLLKNHGAKITDLPEPHLVIKKLMEMGEVSTDEAYKTWNMGVGMILISNDFDSIKEICASHKIEAQIIGEVTDGEIELEGSTKLQYSSIITRSRQCKWVCLHHFCPYFFSQHSQISPTFRLKIITIFYTPSSVQGIRAKGSCINIKGHKFS
ncbi:phosphoribosylformylglycinamidine cyclo-ligase [Candidatus Gracilibacteria bacterium]|nr:phosphoribosylformylglycinamidine cyclo-ligase [Candidatus Gracilibacteria bacterium]